MFSHFPFPMSASLLAVLAASATILGSQTPAEQACGYLKTHFPDNTHLPNSSYYITDNTDFWSQASALGPACDFAPSSAERMGLAVKALKHFRCPFAIRGGGHMPIEGYNNINSSGVLLSSSGLTQLELESDGQSVHVGPGNHWIDVYKFLEPEGKVVVGGRMGVVGVPGFVTGGGISFFSWQYGWASNNLKSYTAVLADGSVVKATPDNAYSDLFWALRGGGNSFALVVDVEMKTYDVPVVNVGIIQHGSANISVDKYAQVVSDFALYGQEADEKATIMPVINSGNGTLSYITYRFHNSNDTSPPVLANFTSQLPVVSDSWGPKTMYQWALETEGSVSLTVGLRERFYIIALYTNKEAFQIVVDTYFSLVFDALADIDLWSAGLAPIPVSKRFLEQSFGDPMSVEPADYFWIEISVTYSDEAKNEPIVTRMLENVNTAVMENLEAAGLMDHVSKFLYLNGADKVQDVWGGYPTENVRRLQSIRQKYDPERVFTDLMPGGWKVADAEC